MCENKVSYYVPRGYDYKEIFTRCGNTDIYGGRAICDECRADRKTMARIERQEQMAKADNDLSRMAGWGDW